MPTRLASQQRRGPSSEITNEEPNVIDRELTEKTKVEDSHQNQTDQIEEDMKDKIEVSDEEMKLKTEGKDEDKMDKIETIEVSEGEMKDKLGRKIFTIQWKGTEPVRGCVFICPGYQERCTPYSLSHIVASEAVKIV